MSRPGGSPPAAARTCPRRATASARRRCRAYCAAISRCESGPMTRVAPSRLQARARGRDDGQLVLLGHRRVAAIASLTPLNQTVGCPRRGSAAGRRRSARRPAARRTRLVDPVAHEVARGVRAQLAQRPAIQRASVMNAQRQVEGQAGAGALGLVRAVEAVLQRLHEVRVARGGHEVQRERRSPTRWRPRRRSAARARRPAWRRAGARAPRSPSGARPARARARA